MNAPEIVRRWWPSIGGLLLVVGAVAAWRGPSAAEVAALAAEIEGHEQRLAELDGRDAVPDTMLAAELPLSVEVGRVVERLEREASAAGIRAITFDTSRDAEPSADVAGAAEDTGLPSFDVDAGDDAAAAGLTTRDVDALFAVYCEARVVTTFPALCRFLGRVEVGSPVTRVRSLLIRATPDGVSAELELETYALPTAGAAAGPPR